MEDVELLWISTNLENLDFLEFIWSALCYVSPPPPSPSPPSCDLKQMLPQRSKLRIAHDHWLRAMLRPQWELQGAVWERKIWSYRCVTPGRWEVCVMMMMMIAYIDSRFYIWRCSSDTDLTECKKIISLTATSLFPLNHEFKQIKCKLKDKLFQFRAIYEVKWWLEIKNMQEKKLSPIEK